MSSRKQRRQVARTAGAMKTLSEAQVKELEELVAPNIQVARQLQVQLTLVQQIIAGTMNGYLKGAKVSGVSINIDLATGKLTYGDAATAPIISNGHEPAVPVLLDLQDGDHAA